MRILHSIAWLAVLLFAQTPLVATADHVVLQEQLLTVDGAADRAPVGSGSDTAFVSNRFGTSDIFHHDGLTSFVTPLASGPGSQSDPDIDGDRVVYLDTSLGDFNIKMALLSTGATQLLTVDSGTDREPAISGNNLVFVTDRLGSNDIFVLDLTTFFVQPFATTSFYENQPAIDGDLVAWQVFNGVDSDVFARVLGGPVLTVADTSASEAGPSVSGNRVAYIIDADVEVYDTVSGARTRITNDAAAQTAVKILGRWVAWSDDRHGNEDIYLYDLDTSQEYRITDDPTDQRLGDLTPDRLLYHDNRLSDFNIWETRFESCPASLVVPGAYEAVEGPANFLYPLTVSFGIRYQQVYHASEFPCANESRALSRLAWRPDTGASPFTWANTDLEVRLSTTSRLPDGLDNVDMDANIGPDETVVFSGPLQLSTAASGAGPLDFDIVFDFSTLFVYTPSDGNLLVEIRKLSPTDPPGAPVLDAVSFLGDTVSSSFSHPAVEAPFLSTGGLITRFEYVAPPSAPALGTVALGLAGSLMGLAGGVALRRRRTRAHPRGR